MHETFHRIKIHSLAVTAELFNGKIFLLKYCKTNLIVMRFKRVSKGDEKMEKIA